MMSTQVYQKNPIAAKTKNRTATMTLARKDCGLEDSEEPV